MKAARYLEALYETSMKAWRNIKHEFELEGSLRDIYIEDIDEVVWNESLSSIRSSGYELKFTHSQKVVALPVSFNELKQLQETDPTTLQLSNRRVFTRSLRVK